MAIDSSSRSWPISRFFSKEKEPVFKVGKTQFNKEVNDKIKNLIDLTMKDLQTSSDFEKFLLKIEFKPSKKDPLKKIERIIEKTINEIAVEAIKDLYAKQKSRIEELSPENRKLVEEEAQRTGKSLNNLDSKKVPFEKLCENEIFQSIREEIEKKLSPEFYPLAEYPKVIQEKLNNRLDKLISQKFKVGVGTEKPAISENWMNEYIKITQTVAKDYTNKDYTNEEESNEEFEKLAIYNKLQDSVNRTKIEKVDQELREIKKLIVDEERFEGKNKKIFDEKINSLAAGKWYGKGCHFKSKSSFSSWILAQNMDISIVDRVNKSVEIYLDKKEKVLERLFELILAIGNEIAERKKMLDTVNVSDQNVDALEKQKDLQPLLGNFKDKSLTDLEQTRISLIKEYSFAYNTTAANVYKTNHPDQIKAIFHIAEHLGLRIGGL